MFKLDWKSVLFGALLAVCVMIFFGANGQSENPDSLPSPKYQISAYSLSDNSGVFVGFPDTGA
ncbi:hypothetical protein IH992_17900, partial [Candidatus Poribacteria bacterium]|nr:hypothetical protein [Candidatus Poribacteria bacterium]